MNNELALTESTYYILLALFSPQHGYGIMQQVEALSKGRVRLAAGTLYGALNALCDKGWIVQLPVPDGSRKKEYGLTERGVQVLCSEIERLRELLKNAEPGPRRCARFAISVGGPEMIESLARAIENDGYECSQHLEKTKDGRYRAIVLDPDKNELELVEEN